MDVDDPSITAIDTGYDEDEVDDIPGAWVTFQDPISKELLWKLSEAPETPAEKDIEKWVSPTDNYFLLSDRYFKDLHFAGQEVEKAYISLTAYKILENLSLDANFPFKFSGEPVLPVRTETGDSQWLQSLTRRSSRKGTAESQKWSSAYKESVSVAQIQNFRNRYVKVDPSKLKLFLRPCGQLSEQQLQQACGPPSEAYVILPRAKHREAPGVGLVHLDTSPFGQYETWVSLTQLKADQKDNLADQKFPTLASANDLVRASVVERVSKRKAPGSAKTIAAWEKAAFKLQQDKNQRPVTKSDHEDFTSVFDMAVSATNMFHVAGKRRGFKGQQQVMGFSATAMAKKFNWALSTPGVPSAAEWLHKCAFSWGGTVEKQGPSNVGEASQQPDNLIFGSYQTNSLMTRSEKNFQNLFARQAKFENELAKANGESANSKLNTVKGHIHTAQHFRNLKWNQTIGEKVPVLNGETPAAPFWIMYNMEYELSLGQNFRPLFLGPSSRFRTRFYPFQRPFFTDIEFNADNKLLQLAYQEHLNAALAAKRPAPRAPIHARIWHDAVSGKPVNVGGAVLSTLSLVSAMSSGRLIEAPMSALSSSDTKHITVKEVPADLTILHLPKRASDDNKGLLLMSTGLQDVQHFKEVLANTDPTTSIPSGFVLSGDLNAFGSLPGKIYTLQGTSANGGVHEIVALANDLTLGGLLPDIEDIDIAGIVIRNMQLEYTDNLSAPADKAPGLYFEADMVLGGILQPVSDILSSLFNQSNPILHVECFLGFDHDWTQFTPPVGITITGSFDNISVPFGDHLVFTSCGVNIRITSEVQEGPIYKVIDVWSYDLFGKGLLNLPGSVAPLTASFSATKDDNLISLMLELDEDMSNAFGVSGLTLSAVEVQAHFDDTIPAKSVGFEVAAIIEGSEENITLDGFYVDGEWALTARITDLSIDAFVDLFDGILGGSMDDVDNDVEFSDIILDISPNGISIEGVLSIDGFTSLDGVVAIDEAGIDFNGAIDNVTMDDITILNASINLYAERKGLAAGRKKAKPIGFAIMGTVEFSGLEITTSLYLEKMPDGTTKWTAYGDYEQQISMSTLAPALQGSFLDLPMRQVSLLAGNADTAAAGFINQFNYPIIKGIQLMATIDSIPALNTLTHLNADGLVLRIGLVKGLGLDFGIILPADNAIRFGRNVTSAGPLSTDIQIAKPPSLVINAGFHVIVPKQDDPLTLTLTLNADPIQAAGTTSVSGFWVNPFGLGQQVKIGPTLSLSVGLTFATFPISGPSLLSLAGGLEIGSTVADFAMSISNDPLQELLLASLNDLSMTDLATFASTVVQVTIPPPDESVIHFEDVSIYISTGTTIGPKQYPPGFSFDAKALVFGRQASVSCSIGREIELAGSVDTFTLGPLDIANSAKIQSSVPAFSPATGQLLVATIDPSPTTGPSFSLAIGKSEQKFMLDGGVKLLDIEAAIHVEAELLPSPNFGFSLALAFTDLLSFSMLGSMLGAIDPKNIGNLDFALSAVFEQNILDFLMDQATQQLTTAANGAQIGFSKAKADLEAAQKAHQMAVDAANAKVTSAKVAFEAKRAAALSQIDEITRDMTSGQVDRQNTVNKASAAFQGKLTSAQQALTQSQTASQLAIAAAESAVVAAQAKAQASIQDKQAAVTQEQNNLNSQFGNVDATLQSAKASVASAQTDENNAQADVKVAQSNADHASVFQKAAKLLELAKKKTIEASKAAALAASKAALQAAEAIVNGPGYAAAKQSLKAAQDALAAAQSTANASVKAAQDAVPGVIATQKALTDAAAAAVTNVQTSGVEVKALQAAQTALNDFNTAEQKLLDAAKAQVAALNDLPEAAAVAVAEAALAAANADVASVTIAQDALDIAQKAEAAAPAVAAWVVKQAGHLFDIQKVEMSGTLRGLVDDGKPMRTHVVGVIAEQNVDFMIDYNIGKTNEMIRDIFGEIWGMIARGQVKTN